MAGRLTPVEPRNCVACGAVIARRPGDNPLRYSRRKSCGGPCESIARSLSKTKSEDQYVPHDCLVCGKPVVRRKTDCPVHYNNRQTCSPDCKTRLRVRDFAKPLRNKRCANCNRLMRVPPELYERDEAGKLPGKLRHEWRNRWRTCSPACWRALAGQAGSDTKQSMSVFVKRYAAVSGLTEESVRQTIRGPR